MAVDRPRLIMPEHHRLYTSTELQEATGLSRKAFRIILDRQLIQPVSTDGRRRYNSEALERLHYVALLREIGLTLDKICELLNAQPAGDACAGPHASALAGEIGQIVQTVTTRIHRLARLRELLVVSRETLLGCSACARSIEHCKHCADSNEIDRLTKLLLVAD